MRCLKRTLSLFLALVMMLSCVATVFAAEETESEERIAVGENMTAVTEESEDKDPADLGYNSVEFLAENTYQYRDDEIVRAIVLLEGQPEAEAGEVGSTKAANQHVKLVNQHHSVFRAMEGIDYEIKFEFTRLLNGFSCDVAYGDLDTIAAIEGVLSVHIANHYDQPELQTPEATKQGTANSVVGNDLMYNAQMNGRGTVVAVLDTGLSLEHEAFRYHAGMVEEVVTQATISAANVYCEGKYISPKIPFAYDYADVDDDVTDSGGHGTHVAGSAVGLAGAFEGNDFNATFIGVAPCAQLLCMKIFRDSGGGTTSDIYFYALEDAYALGADVINMSLGSQNGFTYDSELSSEVFGNIFQRLSDAGVIISVSAGNQRSMVHYASNYYGYEKTIGPEYTDYGTVGSPAAFEGNISVASRDNAKKRDVTIQVDGAEVPFADSCTDGSNGWIQTFAGEDTAYLRITAADGSLSSGAAEDFARCSDSVAGKIAVVSRGDLSFEEMIENAAGAGAAGCIVVNDRDGNVLMSVDTFEIPAISLEHAALELFSDSGNIYTDVEQSFIKDAGGSYMSEFSNWGTTPMLTLDPTVTGIGGQVNSAIPGGTDTYGVKSGTSMAAPNLTGTFASLLSAIYTQYPDMAKPEAAELAKDLIFSGAILLLDSEGYHYSPRKVGTGLGSGWNAVQLLREAAYITNPLQELGHDPQKTGVYTMSLELKNTSGRDLVYTDFEAYVLFDKLLAGGDGLLRNAMRSEYAYAKDDATTDIYGRGASVSYYINGTPVSRIDLAAGRSVTVNVTITLTQEQKDYFDYNYPNGSFVEGYVVFNEVSGDKVQTSTHATFLAYYGDWTQAPVFEEADFEDVIQTEVYLHNTVADAASGKTYADQGQTWKDSDMLKYYANPNMALLTDSERKTIYAYAGGGMLGYGEYDPSHISFTTPASDSDRKYGTLLYMEPYLLRNVVGLTMRVSNNDTGEVYYAVRYSYVRKARFDTDKDAWRTSVKFMWNGTDRNGVYVPSGTVATITYEAVLPYGNTVKSDVWSFDVMVDYVAPRLHYTYNNSTKKLTVTASDENYLQALCLEAPNGKILEAKTFSSNEKGKSFTATFDIGSLTKGKGLPYLNICALDYATNITIEKINLPDNNPAVVSFSCPGGVSADPIVTEVGAAVTLPEPSGSPTEGSHDYTFLGWVSAPLNDTKTKPSYYTAGQSITVQGNQIFYALYSYPYFIISTRYTTIPQDTSGSNGLLTITTMHRVHKADGLGTDTYAFMVKSNSGIYYTMQNLQDKSYIAQMATTEDFESAPYSIMVTDAHLFRVTYSNGAMTIQDEAGNYLYGNIDGEGYVRLSMTTTACTWTPTFNSDGSVYLKSNEGYYLSLRDDFTDKGSNGNPMFMVSDNTGTGATGFYLFRATETDAVCKHSYTAKVTEATCLADGYTIYTCSKCKVRYMDNRVSALGHNIVTDAAVSPTCTRTGKTEGKHCENCGLVVISQTTIPATGHSFSTTVVHPTCDKDGYTNYACTKCKYSYTGNHISATGHKYGSVITTPATCDKAGIRTYTCYKCNDTYTEVIPTTEHHYQSVVTAPTCETDGYTTYTCSVCRHSYVDQIVEKTDHSYTSETTAPTCETDGYTTYTCTVCRYSYVDQIVEKTDHSYTSETTAPACETDGCTTYTCSYCGHSYSVRIPMTGHSYTTEVIAPTCSEKGYTKHTCTGCGDSYTTDMVLQTGHRYVGRVTTAPTCVMEGVRTYTCSKCNASYTTTVAATGHKYTPKVTAPSCTDGGYTTYTCLSCRDSYVADPVAALGHNPVTDAAVAATCTASGLTEGSHCAACNAVLIPQETIDQLGHNYRYTNLGENHDILCSRCNDHRTESHSYLGGVCVCGAIKSLLPTQVKIKLGHSLTLDSDLCVKYRVKYTDIEAAVPNYVTEGAYLVVEKDVYPAGGEKTVATYTLTPDLSGDPARMVFDLKGIQAAEMGSELRAVLHIFDAEGEEYTSEVDIYSIRVYAEQYLETYDYELQPKFFTMLIDLLNYGAAAQVNFGRRTDELVNAGFEAYQQYATKELAAELTDVKETIPNDRSITAVTKMGFSINLADRTEINAKMTMAEGYTMEDISKVEVRNAAGDVVDTITEFVLLVDDNNRVQLTFSGVKSVNMRDMFYFVVYVGDQIASDTYGYSIEASAKTTIANSTGSSADMILACMYYGDSAAAYFGK